MATLQDGFKFKPNFHTSDPKSSKDAAARMELGPRAWQARYVGLLVSTYPDSTARELEKACNWELDVYQIRRRLHDMDGVQVEKSGERKCEVAKTQAVTWRAR